jgi:hypothetical protein
MIPDSNQQHTGPTSQNNSIGVTDMTSQSNISPTIPPGVVSQLGQPYPSFSSLPYTKNPFVSSSVYPRNLQSFGTSNVQPQSNPDDSFSSEFELDDDDRFGLKCLGIFGDSTPTVQHTTSSSMMSNMTRNPFV